MNKNVRHKVAYDIDQICRDIGENYEYIYDRYDDVPNYSEMIDAGDAVISDEGIKPLLSEIIKSRGDIFSSDREVAALYMALYQNGVLSGTGLDSVEVPLVEKMGCVRRKTGASVTTAYVGIEYATNAIKDKIYWEVYNALPMIKIVDDATRTRGFDLDLSNVPNSRKSVLRAIRDAAQDAGFELDPTWGDIDYFCDCYRGWNPTKYMMGAKVKKCAYTIDDLSMAQINDLRDDPGVWELMYDVYTPLVEDAIRGVEDFCDSIDIKFEYQIDAWNNFWPEIDYQSLYDGVVGYENVDFPDGESDGSGVSDTMLDYWRDKALPILRESFAQITYDEDGYPEDDSDNEFYGDCMMVCSELSDIAKRGVDGIAEDFLYNYSAPDGALGYVIEMGYLDDTIEEMLDGDGHEASAKVASYNPVITVSDVWYDDSEDTLIGDYYGTADGFDSRANWFLEVGQDGYGEFQLIDGSGNVVYDYDVSLDGIFEGEILDAVDTMLDNIPASNLWKVMKAGKRSLKLRC